MKLLTSFLFLSENHYDETMKLLILILRTPYIAVDLAGMFAMSMHFRNISSRFIEKEWAWLEQGRL